MIAVGPTGEPKLTDPEFLVGSAGQRFEVIRRIAPLVSDYLVELREDPIAGVVVECRELSLRPNR